MAKTQEVMSARARARKAKAELDARRAEQDRRILDATTEFYDAAESRAAAQDSLAAAVDAQAASVSKLVELGQTIDEIAVLCGIPQKEVRELRKSRRAPATAAVGSDTTRENVGEQIADSPEEPATAAA